MEEKIKKSFDERIEEFIVEKFNLCSCQGCNPNNNCDETNNNELEF